MCHRPRRKKNTKCYCLTCYFARHSNKWTYPMGVPDGHTGDTAISGEVLGWWRRKDCNDAWSLPRSKICNRLLSLHPGGFIGKDI